MEILEIKHPIEPKIQPQKMEQTIDTTIHTASITSVIGGSVATVVGTYSNDLFRTLILATVGSLVSFGMSILLKWLFSKKKKKS